MEPAEFDHVTAREAVRATIADNLRGARIRARLKQEDVASGMRALGFEKWSRPTVSEIERYRRPVTVEELIMLSRVLDRPLPHLLARDADPAEAVELVRAFGGRMMYVNPVEPKEPK